MFWCKRCEYILGHGLNWCRSLDSRPTCPFLNKHSLYGAQDKPNSPNPLWFAYGGTTKGLVPILWVHSWLGFQKGMSN